MCWVSPLCILGEGWLLLLVSIHLPYTPLLLLELSKKLRESFPIFGFLGIYKDTVLNMHLNRVSPPEIRMLVHKVNHSGSLVNSLQPLGRYINMDPYPTGLLISWT